MSNYIDNTQEIIDVRDIIGRVEELETEQDGIESPCAELEELRGLLSELAGYGGDEQFEGDGYPSTLIHYDYFETAMDELLEDIGAIPRDLPSYLNIEVNYDALLDDYSSIEVGNQTYWYR